MGIEAKLDRNAPTRRNQTQAAPKRQRDADLSPVVLGELDGAAFALKPRRPLQLQPAWSDSREFICIEHEEWGVDVFAPTRGELLEELKEQLVMLWVEYGREVDAKLSPPALRVKRQLHADWEEVANAKGQA